MLSMIAVNLVDQGTRLRDVNEDQVNALIGSIRDVGVLHPIVVYERQVIRDNVFVPGFGLVAGLHRLVACQRLGMEEIPAQIVALSDLERQIAECDENLCGPHLSKAERTLFTRRRKMAYEALHPETRHGATGNGREKSGKVCHSTPAERFTADTAAKTGRSERAVRLDAERGEKIAEDILEEIKGTELDKGTVLDALAKTPREKQPEKLAEIKAAVTAKAKKPKPAPSPAQENIEAKLADLMVSYIAKEHWSDIQAMLPAIKPGKLAAEFEKHIAKLGAAA